MIEESRYQIALTTRTPFRIGGPDDPLSAAENAVARVGGRLAIPGSALKGALRAEIERFLIDSHYDRAAGRWPPEKAPLQPCIPTPRLSPDEQGLVSKGLYRENCRHQQAQGGRRQEREQAAPPLCPVCYFLGAMGLPGFVRVPFLFSQTAATSFYSASIDRAAQTVKHGTNRPYELVPDGAEFVGELVVILADTVLGWRLGQRRPLGDRTRGDIWLPEQGLDPQECLRTYVLERLRAIKLLGGYKSKGCGEVDIQVRPVGS